MSNKPIIPIFKALTKLTKKDIVGSLDNSFQNGVNVPLIRVHDFDLPYCSKYIDDETLRISLDNGKEWYTMERLEELIELGLRYEYACRYGSR